jgi:hypothetical protein
MVKPNVVAYLEANLKQHPIETLRRQLAQEGIGDADFEDSLKTAMRAPVLVHGSKTPSRAGLVFLMVGVASVAALAALFIQRQSSRLPHTSTTIDSATGESAFMGSTGYVVRLPKGYDALAVFKDEKKTIQIVHFYRTGTDPSNFSERGLYSQLGIVRLDVQPNPWAGDLMGPEELSRTISAERTARGDKFSRKDIQVGPLCGMQITTELPQPRTEAYLLGETVLYHFYAGQEDEVYRGILNSLRDPHADR